MLIQEIFSFDNFRNAEMKLKNTGVGLQSDVFEFVYSGTLKRFGHWILLALVCLFFLWNQVGNLDSFIKKKNFSGYCIVATVASVVLVWLANVSYFFANR